MIVYDAAEERLSLPLQVSLYTGLLAAWIALAGSLYFSEVMGFIPCKLCWYQRILMYPLAGLIPLAIWRRDGHLPYLVLPFSLVGEGISIYHYLLQKTTLFGAPVACSADAPCTTAWINWFGFVTIPFLAMLGFLIITLAMVMLAASEELSPPAPAGWLRWPAPVLIAVVVATYIAGAALAEKPAEPAIAPSVGFPLVQETPSAAFAPLEPSERSVRLEQGALLYDQVCANCHGLNGEGVPGLGSPLATSQLVQNGPDETLATVIREGRAADAPENRSGLAMPPRGGRPDLTDSQIEDIILFLREGL